MINAKAGGEVLTGAAGASGKYLITFDGTSTDATAFLMENDTLAAAMQNPLGSVDGKWLVKRADMSRLTPTIGATRDVNMGLGTDINDVNAQSLDPVIGYQVTVSNARTDDLNPTYPGGDCAPTASGPDALYRFTPNANANVQVRLNTSGWNGHVVLYNGSTGAPLDTRSGVLKSPSIQIVASSVQTR